MRVIHALLLALVVMTLGGAGVLGATGGLRFEGAVAAPNFDPSGPPQATSNPTPAPKAARFASPSASPGANPAASPTTSPVVASSEIVAVASQTDQKLTLVDPASGKVTGSLDLGIPPKNMALAQNGRTAWVFSAKPGESDFLTVDLLKAERKDSKRLHDNPSAAAFSTDGMRAYVALGGGTDSPPAPTSNSGACGSPSPAAMSCQASTASVAIVVPSRPRAGR